MRDIAQLLLHWANAKPNARAYVFVSSRGTIEAELTYGALLNRALGVAAALRQGGSPGQRAALVFSPGLEFVVGFFGCLLAGIIAVPMSPPRRLAVRDSADAIIANCTPHFILTTTALSTRLRTNTAGRATWSTLKWLAIDDVTPQDSAPAIVMPQADQVAFLQYTSGSTSEPKGAVITHGNLASNLAMMQRSFHTSADSVFACWLPLFHDMGLIGNALHAVAVGATCVLMAPLTFMQRPLSWLRTISDYHVDFAGAPNFAYDHCVDRLGSGASEGLDLSSWRVAFNGAEPVRQATLERFARTFAPFGFDGRALFPCYGMAEATVMISGKAKLESAPVVRDREGSKVVGCGTALCGEEIAIVDPANRQRTVSLAVGEIWVRGPHVATGYWADPVATAATFHARLDGESAAWLRTGDLGFLDPSGELFITGRMNDLIIIRGENHHPQDIEFTVRDCHAALRSQVGAAFTVAADRGEARLIIVQEISREWRNRVTKHDLEAAIREAVVKEHGLAVHQVAIVPPGSVPTTTSGKVQRSRARALWLANGL